MCPQIGVSGYRIDLGVVDPGAPGCFLAGIECDGATYHRSASARDRDRLRQDVLVGLGWQILRVWSTEWWNGAEQEIARLDQALHELKSREAKETALVAEAKSSVTAKADTTASGTVDEEPARQDLDPERFYAPSYHPTLAALAGELLKDERPMRDDVLAQRVARLHGFQRTGARIREMVAGHVSDQCDVTREGDKVFFWPPGSVPAEWASFRRAPEGGQRDPAEVPMEELLALARQILRDGTGEEDALLAMRDACGLGRLREVTRGRLLPAIHGA